MSPVIIGIDLDNTILDYNNAFKHAAQQLELLSEDWVNNNLSASSGFSQKSLIKKHILSLNKGHYKWESLQGQVYGRYIHHAQIFPGAANFLLHCHRRGEIVHIISHKTEFGHYDKSKTPLRKVALNFLEKNNLLSGDFGITTDDIFFFDTRKGKVNKIVELGCNYFIDDLAEIFEEPDFPQNIKKILFDLQSEHSGENSFNSWYKINELFFNDIEKNDVSSYVENGLKEEVKTVKKIRARENSSVFKIEMKSRKKYVAKLYPDPILDDRKRLKKETKAFSFLHTHGIDSVPKVIWSDCNLNFGLYEWINGSEINEVTSDNIIDAVSFIESLAAVSKNTPYAEFRLASAACLSGKMIESQIQDRYRKLHGCADSNPPLKDFLEKQFSKALNKMMGNSQKSWPDDLDIQLSKENQLLSPSDLGFHNAFQTKGGLKFIDFEYFGWDDPAKLTCDFMLHPGMTLADEQKKLWLREMKDIFSEDTSFNQRLAASYCLYGLCWCLMMLNVFIDSLGEKIISVVENNKIEQKQTKQLEKSKKMLIHLNETHKNGLTYE